MWEIPRLRDMNKNINLPLHDHQEALLALVGVLEDVLDVDDVDTAAGPPVEVDLTTRLHIVFQNLTWPRLLPEHLHLSLIHI